MVPYAHTGSGEEAIAEQVAGDRRLPGAGGRVCAGCSGAGGQRHPIVESP